MAALTQERIGTVTTSGPKPRRPSVHIPLLTQLKAKNLYLVQSLPYSEICTATGLSLDQLNGLIARQGWAKLRQQRETRMKEVAHARMAASVDDLQDALASECEEIVFNGLTRAKEATVSGSEYAAKDFQAWAGGVRALAAVARTARGLDQDQPRTSGQINLFLTVGERVTKPISPAIDLPVASSSPEIPATGAAPPSVAH